MSLPADPFGILGLPRRFWLDSEELKRRYLALSAEAHPDRVHSSSGTVRQEAETRSAALNAAYNRLRNTRERLLCLIELNDHLKPSHVQNVPAAALGFFAPVAELTRAVDSFLAEKRQASSPMIKAALFQKSLGWTDKIQELQLRLAAEISRSERQIKALDESFGPPGRSIESIPAPSLAQAAEIAATLGFLEKWQAQLMERLTNLAF